MSAETTSEVELLPCPFCGSSNIDAKGWMSLDAQGPACDDCGASAGQISQGHADNVHAWNTRSTPAQEQGWRDIASAPKDGTRIDVWSYWPEHGEGRRTADAYWNGRNWQLGQFNEEQFVHRPVVSHWMPLQSPPSKGDEA